MISTRKYICNRKPTYIKIHFRGSSSAIRSKWIYSFTVEIRYWNIQTRSRILLQDIYRNVHCCWSCICSIASKANWWAKIYAGRKFLICCNSQYDHCLTTYRTQAFSLTDMVSTLYLSTILICLFESTFSYYLWQFKDEQELSKRLDRVDL